MRRADAVFDREPFSNTDDIAGSDDHACASHAQSVIQSRDHRHVLGLTREGASLP